jgi:hypothetical protein
MKTCPICHTLFTPAVPHQEYDRLSCRKKAERQRARLRDKGVGIVRKQHYGGADHATMVNPNVSSLDEMAQVYLNNRDALPTIFSGLVPEWTPPVGVRFVNQADGSGDWVMNGMSEFDMALAGMSQNEIQKIS